MISYGSDSDYSSTKYYYEEDSSNNKWYDSFYRVPEVHQLFVKELLWEQLQQYLYQNETDFVRREIGSSVIQENEDLMNEVKALIDILHNYREDNERYMKRIENSRTSLHNSANLRLLRDHILTLASTLQDRAKEYGKVNIDVLLTSSREKEVYNFVVNSTVPSRPQTPRPCSRQSVVSSSSDGSSSLSVDIELEKLKQDLNFFNIDKVAFQLREALKSEHQALLDDAEFLRECIEEETNFFQQASEFRPPSTMEIRDLESKLQERVETTQLLQKLEKTNKQELEPIPKKLNLIPHSSKTQNKKLVDPSRDKKRSSVLRLRETVKQYRETTTAKTVNLFDSVWNG